MSDVLKLSMKGNDPKAYFAGNSSVRGRSNDTAANKDDSNLRASLG